LVLVALDDVGKFTDEGNGFLIGQFKVHFRDMGPELPGLNPSVAPGSSHNDFRTGCACWLGCLSARWPVFSLQLMIAEQSLVIAK
jgi:hypothetical protein